MSLFPSPRHVIFSDAYHSGNAFVIISRARGWWIVQREPLTSGILDSGTSQQGWVPAGCLLETSVSVAAGSNQSGSSTFKTPILPLHIVSTNFPGIALIDYQSKGDEELDMIKGDTLRVFKRYNHWAYVSCLMICLRNLTN